MAEELDHDLERHLPPTPRRLERAREEGDVARSRELATFLLLGAAALGLWWSGPSVVSGLLDLLHRGLTLDARATSTPVLMVERLSALTWEALLLCAPLLLALLVAAAAGPLFLGGWLFSSRAMMPQLARLNPLRGLSNIFSRRGLVELGKALLETAVLGGIAWWVVSASLEHASGLAQQPLGIALPRLARDFHAGLTAFVAGLAALAAVGVPIALWRHHARLRMTLEEYRREIKETDGDPQLKARVRSLQREVARKRMMAAVPTADVVVTNPTHFAVALAYDEGRMRAPRVVAKGRDAVAARIREIALAHEVPLFEAPPLARALYRGVEIGEEIPAALYGAVAQVLAYIWQLAAARGTGAPQPKPPVVEVAPELLGEGSRE